MSFIRELQRRNVVRVAIAYLLVAWLIAQVSELVLGSFGAPEWVLKTVLFLLVIGFPVAVLLAWAFELTPEGVRRESGIDDDGSSTRRTGRRLELAIFVALAVALGYFVYTNEPDLSHDEAFDSTILERPMVAVLPFTNTSGNPEYDYLSLGLMDEIIVNLQRFKAFPVVSRGAALMVQDRDKPVTEIAQELQASYIVDSSIRRNRENLRVLVTMSNRKGEQVWARPFELAPDFENLFTVVDEVAAGLVSAVRSSGVERIQSASRPPIAAWEHYIKGLAVILNWRPEDHEMGLSHIEKALELDPNFAEAWWALGEIIATKLMGSSLVQNLTIERLESMEFYFRRAHEISPFHGAACGCLGLILVAMHKDEEAFVLLSEALEANPMSSALRVDYAQALVSEGHLDDARTMAISAARMEPVGMDLSLTWLVRAIADLGQEQMDEAKKNVFRAIYAHPQNLMVTPTAIVVLYELGDRGAAESLYKEFVTSFPEFSFDNPFTRMIQRPIDQVIASQHLANTDYPVDSMAVLDELAKLTSQ